MGSPGTTRKDGKSAVGSFARASTGKLTAKAPLCPRIRQTVAPNPHRLAIAGTPAGILLTVQGSPRLLDRVGADWKFAMIETVSALMGLVSAAIFLAHAFEGYRTRA
jgi:hypothetical protein